MPGLTRHPLLHLSPSAPSHITRVRRTADNIHTSTKYQQTNSTQQAAYRGTNTPDTGEKPFNSPQTTQYARCVSLYADKPTRNYHEGGAG